MFTFWRSSLNQVLHSLDCLSVTGSCLLNYFNSHFFTIFSLSGIFAALTLGIHIEYRQHEWRRKPNFLRVIMFFGCLAQFLAISAFIIYIALGIHYKQSK